MSVDYTKHTSEYDAWPLIPETIANEIIDGIVEDSAVLTQFNRLPNMSSRVHRMPLLDSLGAAEFTTGDLVDDDLVYPYDSDVNIDDAKMLALKSSPYGSGTPGALPLEAIGELKQTHGMKWSNVFIIAEPIAIILPIPDEVLDDSSYDLWNALRPRIVEAFGRRIDEAVIWGKSRPPTWPSGIVPAALSRGNYVSATSKLGDDISDIMGKIEEQGFEPTGFLADVSLKSKLRNTRDDNGYPLFAGGVMATPDSLYGLPVAYVKNGSFYRNVSQLITGKMDEAKFAVRQDLSFKIFEEGVISDETGAVKINLMQNDMKALRVVMRMGWAVPNPIHQLNPDREGYPFAVLKA